jgi:hypothetical protein
MALDDVLDKDASIAKFAERFETFISEPKTSACALR